MDVLRPLEERLNKRFTGATGYDLKEFILDNIDVNLLEYKDDEYLDNLKASNVFYTIQCNKTGLRLIKKYLIPACVMSNTKTYKTFDEALESNERSFEIEIGTNAQIEYRSVSKLLNLLKEITKNKNVIYKLDFSCSSQIQNKWQFTVQCGGFRRELFKTITTDYDYLILAYLELAVRCANDTIKNFISSTVASVEFINRINLNDTFNY